VGTQGTPAAAVFLEHDDEDELKIGFQALQK